MRVVVTGGTGFLGTTIARQLAAEGHEVVLLDPMAMGRKGLEVEGAEVVQGDINDTGLLRRVLDGADEVYHQAGLLGTAELQTQVSAAIRTNIVGTVNLFEVAEEVGVPRILYPMKPTVWNNTYTITKHAAEQFAKMFNGRGVTKIVGLRYFNGYGPGQSLYPIRKIIPSFAIQAMRGRPIEVFGTGEQTVDMCFSEDLGKLSTRLLRAGHVDTYPDCGSGVEMTVKQVAEDVNSYFGNTAGITHLPMRAGEDDHTELVADMTELTSILGDLKLTSWETALPISLDWYANLPAEQVDAAYEFYNWTKVAVAS